MEANKRFRSFIGVFSLQVISLLFIIIHVGRIFDIPFVPNKLVLRLPAFCIYSVLYVYTLLICLNQIRVMPQLNEVFKVKLND